MALVALEIPKVGLVMENARLVRWLKSVGDVVKQGEPLLELEMEKSVVEIESTESGRLVEILFQADQEVRVGDRIAWLENDAQAAAADHGAAAGRGTVPRQACHAATVSAPPSLSQAATTSPPLPSATSPAVGRIKSSPVARRLAAEQAVDLARIAGTGPRGRVQLTDVQRAIDARASAEATSGSWSDSGGRRMTQVTQLLGSYWTLAVGADPMGDQRCCVDFRLRVESAAKAGFTAMGFWHADIAETRKKYSFSEMKRILDGNGIAQIEVEWLLDWFCTDYRRVAADETRKLLLDAAEALGARHIKIGDLGNDCADVPLLTEEFGVLCRQAAERGTNVLFEMLPAQFSRAPSLDQVLAICHGSGAKNGGIMLDNLHLQRTATPSADIVRKIGREIPLGVEINDGTLAMPVNLHDSVVNKRLLPGDGEFDIAAFLHAVWTQGYNGPIGVEVLNEYIRKWPVDTAATEAFAKTRAVVMAAREKWEAGAAVNSIRRNHQ